MSLVTVSTHIAAPPEEVWKTVMDPTRLGEWVTIHRALRAADSGPPQVGYEMEQRVHLRGVTLDVHWRLVECQPCSSAVWEGQGPAHAHAHIAYTLRPEGDGTRFDYRNEFHPPLGLLGALFSRALAGPAPQREAQRTMERLRELLEDRDT